MGSLRLSALYIEPQAIRASSLLAHCRFYYISLVTADSSQPGARDHQERNVLPRREITRVLNHDQHNL